MDAKEKAIQLIVKFRLNVLDYEGCGINEHKAKQCALIAANEVLQYSKAHGFIGLTEYYEEVKKQIMDTN